MIGKIGTILTGTQAAVLQSIKSTQRLIDTVQLRLASGKDVNSALDNPQNFFLSRALSDQANDLNRLLDGIKLNIRTIQGADEGAEGVIKLLDQIEALVGDAKTELYPGNYTTLRTSLSDDQINEILATNPGLTYSTDSQSFYRLVTAPANWATANAAAQAATLNVPDGLPEDVTGHLIAINSAEENAYVFTQIGGVSTWLGGSDQAAEGTWRWTGGPQDGEQFWQGGASGSAVNGSYANWGATEPNNLGDEDALHMRSDGRWNDWSAANVIQYIIEWDSGLYNNSRALLDRAAQYAQQYKDLLEQIDLLVKDTQYRGIGLLSDEDLTTYFNPVLMSFLVSEGIDASSTGLGLLPIDFLDSYILEAAETDIGDARNVVRSYAGSLAVDLSIITTRLDFTQNKINIRKSGMDDLVVADQNEQGANLLALQTRQQLGVTALSLASQSASAVTRLF